MGRIENPKTGAIFIKRKAPITKIEQLESVSGAGVDDKSIQTKKTKIVPGYEIFQKYHEMSDKGKIKMDDFKDLYSLSVIERDKKRVEDVKKKQEKPTPSGIVLENSFYDLSEKLLSDKKSGNEIHAQLLSVFDDTMADSTRADVVLEIKTPNGEVVRLLVDVTTAITPSKLLEKREKCTKNIKEGRLHSIKYFQSKIDGIRGRQINLPMVIVGMGVDNVHDFCARIGEGNDLANDYAAFMFLDEIVKQLGDDYVMSKERNNVSHEMIQILLKTYETFNAILEIKNNLRPHDFEEKVAKKDDVYSYLMS